MQYEFSSLKSDVQVGLLEVQRLVWALCSITAEKTSLVSTLAMMTSGKCVYT